MPFIFTCSQCHAVVLKASFDELMYSETVENIVRRKVGNKCPKCGHKFSFPFVKVDVKPNMETLGKSPYASSFKHDYHKTKKSSTPMPKRPFLIDTHDKEDELSVLLAREQIEKKK